MTNQFRPNSFGVVTKKALEQVNSELYTYYGVVIVTD
jgi:hypothetical protein